MATTTSDVAFPGRPRTARDIVARNVSVVASIARGRRQADVAAAHGITVRQVQRILAAWHETSNEDVVDPWKEARDTVALLRQAIADMAAIEERPDNDAAHIGATRLKVDVTERLMLLLSHLGVFPRNISALNSDQELAAMCGAIAELADEHAVSDDFIQAMVEMAERGLSGTRPARIGAAA